MFCDKTVDCALGGKPSDDCPVEAMIKAQEELKQGLKEILLASGFFKFAIWILEKLSALLGDKK